MADWNIEGVARQYEGGRERADTASHGVRFEIREATSGRSKTVRIEAARGGTLSEEEARRVLLAYLQEDEPPESIIVPSP